MRKRTLGILAGALVVGAATVAAILLVREWRDVEGPVLTTDLIAVRADVLPHEFLFGDALTARIDVLIDRAFVDAATVRVAENFAPYRVEGRVKREQEDLGATTRLRFTYALACLRGGDCLPDPEGRRYELPEVQVSYVVTGLEGRQTTRVPLPVLAGASRLGGINLDQPNFRAEGVEVPAPSYRVPPGVLAAGALGLAGVLVLAALLLLAPLLPLGGLRRRLAARRTRSRTDLERALAQVRATAPEGDGEQVRPALERLASELGRVDHETLAEESRRLAWSEPEPQEPDVGGLSEEVEQVITETRS